MRILLSPQRSDAPPPILSVAGAVLTINGEDFDFTQLSADGDSLPREAISSPYALGARNSAGTVEVIILFPVGVAASVEQRFPSPINVASGAVTLP